nr:TPA_asm: hypothetical protein HUJ06_013459 [Nelumbo nucifera]
MAACFNIDMRTTHIKSRMRTLKPIYMESKKLLGTSGFSWNESMNQIITDPVVWDDYIKANPLALYIKDRVMEMFEKMHTFLGNDHPMGDNAMVGFESMTECNTDVDGTKEDDPEFNDDATTPLIVDEFIYEDGTQSVSNNNRRQVPQAQKKRVHGSKPKSNQDFIDAIDRMNIIMSKIASALIVDADMDF